MASEHGAMDATMAFRKLQEASRKATANTNDYDLRLKREREMREQVLAEKERMGARLENTDRALKEAQTTIDRQNLALA